MSPAAPHRRRQWLVNRPLQLRFVKAMTFSLVVTAALAVIAVYAAAWWTLASFELTQDQLMVAVVQSICWLIFLEVVLLTPFIMWWGVRLTHRIAGPLVRIHAALAALQAGQRPQEIHLREGDELQELAAQVNALAAVLQRR